MTPHDQLALRTFGRTRSAALTKWECIRCSRSVNAMRLEAQDWKEYRITALCPACFVELTPEEKP